MKTVSELGKALKRKHPDLFGHLSDADAGRKVKREFPEQYKEYVEEAITVRPKQQVVRVVREEAKDLFPRTQLSHIEKIDKLQTFYTPGSGRFSSWLKTYKAEGRVRMQSFITQEIEQIILQGAMLEDAAISSQKKRVEYESWIVENEYHLFVLKQNAYLLEKATTKGVSVEGLEALTMDDNTARLEKEKQELSHKQELELRQQKIEEEERLSRIKINEKRAMAEIETDNEVRLAHEKLKFQILAERLTNQQVVGHIQDLIDAEYIKIAQVKEEPSIPITAREQIVQSRERIIAMYMRQQDETHNKVLGQRDAEL